MLCRVPSAGCTKRGTTSFRELNWLTLSKGYESAHVYPFYANRLTPMSAITPRQLVALVVLALTFYSSAQDEMSTFKVSVASALVWDADSPNSPTSSAILDPLSGQEIHKLSASGIEVSSRLGYERVSFEEAGKLINYTTTIANNTDLEASVRYGGASIDGHIALPLWIASNKQRVNKRDRKDVWELGRMYCFKNGFASSNNYFSSHAPAQVFTIRPKTALTISSVTKDPRSYSARCSVDGCHLIGTIRYYITVNNRDYVFVWPGRSVVYCGE